MGLFIAILLVLKTYMKQKLKKRGSRTVVRGARTAPSIKATLLVA
jgi:hypothetical protein